MATRLKPTRLNVDNIPEVGDGASYQNDNDFHWSEGGGDMSYEDFEWVTLTGNSLVIENISNNVTPTGNFTVTAGTLRPGIEYVLRVNTGNTPYTMTLGTGVTNPNGYSTELTPNKVNQFKFIATSDSQLELEGVDTSDFVTLGTQQTITAKKTFNVEPELGTAKTTDATNNGTKLATEAQVYKKIDKVQSPTADHLASLTSGGEVADSGIAKSTVELNTNKETGDAPTDTTSKYPSSHTVKKYVDDQVAAATSGAVSDASYDPTTWDGVTGIAPSKNAVRDKIVSMDSNISTNTSDISTINGKIPSAASTSNQLADKAYVGDSINSVTAYYITKNANGDQFATYAELAAATTFYSGGVARVPTRNDYTIVLDDENHNHATTRYIYNNGWEYQYTVNETPLTQAQLDALNSGITAGKVSTYDAYATNKQDTLVSGTNIKTVNNTSILGSGNIDTNQVSDTAYGSGWDGVTGTAPSKNAVYDKINAMDTTIGNKANDSDVVKLTGNQTINGTKTFGTSPVVPSKTADATNTGTAIATEAQVYKKQDTLVSGTSIKTINGESVLGSGNISISAPSYTAGNGIDITNDEIGLDGTYEGKDYSAMQGPAPDGFHVPLNTEWQAVKDIRTALGGGSSDGTNFGITLKLPIAGGRNYAWAGVYGQGAEGYYWSSSRDSADRAYYLYFYSSSLNPQGRYMCASGYSVRCFKNSPTVPTSSWTKLYGTSIEAGGIFWSSADGLISLSSDGQTWITIQDKNLGATQVWNSGDTLSEANCGKYYQRGNNYGFPFTGNVTTSSTQVDASAYGPGNYYNSSTFIMRSSSPYGWDTTNNGNLRGGVTGIQTASGSLVVGGGLYKLVVSESTPASGTSNNIITISTGSTKGLYVGTTKIA